jgi:RNA polymerase sigma factor (sigma-70 family)
MSEKVAEPPTRKSSGSGSLVQALLQHRQMLYGFIFSLVRDVAAAEEIFQQVAMVAIEKERKKDEVIREPIRWLKETARRTVQAGFQTRQGRMIVVEPEYLEQIADSFEVETDADYQYARLTALQECLQQVSTENHELLRRHYVDGSTYPEMGSELHRSPGALRVAVHVIVRRLAGCIRTRLARSERESAQ